MIDGFTRRLRLNAFNMEKTALEANMPGLASLQSSRRSRATSAPYG